MSNIKADLILYTIPEEGKEKYALITIQVLVPAYVWTELLTAKRFARNASSNRAMTVSKNIDELGYYLPDLFYKKGKGMQSGEMIAPFSEMDSFCINIWRDVWEYCSNAAKTLEENGIAKEQASRVLPTFKMMKGLVTGTFDAWNKWLELRDNSNADVAMQELAKQVKAIIFDKNKAKYSFYHVPFEVLGHKKVISLKSSVAKIARVSYLSSSDNIDDDVKLADRLIANKHFSPLEHTARWDTICFPSAICCKDEDMFMGEEEGFNSWTNLRAYYEECKTIEGF